MSEMNSQKLREKFLKFFEKKGHRIVPSSSLLPDDRSVLFTTAGMQQFKEYFLGKKSPYGRKVTSCQKCFRTSDIEEVGDAKHLTFLEMLGNFSFGEYFKKEAIELAWQFLVGPLLRLDPERFWITVFQGDKEVPADEESYQIWNKWLGIEKEKIYQFGKEENFWGPTGQEGPCGPTTEIHYDLTGQACSKGKKCFPNCSCGRFLELWNLVFNEYYQDRRGTLTLLKKKGVDTGMGLERLAMVCQEKSSVFETDLFEPIIQEIEKNSPDPYSRNPQPYRIIADHIRGAVFLASEGVFPSNLEQGYVLRRILRRIMRFERMLDFPQNFLIPLARKVVEIYQDEYRELKAKESEILTVIQKEEEKFSKTLEKGLKQFEKIAALGDIEGGEAFHLFDTYGFPLELTKELAQERGLKVDQEGFEEAFKRHREISRAGVEKKFGGIGKEADYQSKKLHTATHLLQAALRKILGESIRQMGSDINPQRLRFDFSYPRKITEEEKKKIEELVNQKIKENLKVKKEKMSYQGALKSGALVARPLEEKIDPLAKVSVFSINDFSREICAGPHVSQTSELGYFKITKEESLGGGLRRIRAILE